MPWVVVVVALSILFSGCVTAGKTLPLAKSEAEIKVLITNLSPAEYKAFTLGLDSDKPKLLTIQGSRLHVLWAAFAQKGLMARLKGTKRYPDSIGARWYRVTDKGREVTPPAYSGSFGRVMRRLSRCSKRTT